MSNETRRWPPPDLVASIRTELAGRSSAIGLVLGSGLGGIAEALENPWSRAAEEIPGYPASTVAGHAGRLLLGRISRSEIWVVQGRVHLYEGYTVEEVTRPVRLLHALGVRTLILTNAAGSLDPEIAPGDLVLSWDAISLFFRPLAAPRRQSGPRPEPPIPWRRRDRLTDPGLFAQIRRAAAEQRIPLREGVLVGSLGPSYETVAEISTSRRLGGSVASMSTVPEAVEARELGMRSAILSLVTNYGTGLAAETLTHEEVVARASHAGKKLGDLLAAVIPHLAPPTDPGQARGGG
jgi:inosine/guanosine/xanthosine phosphorylase family protein